MSEPTRYRVADNQAQLTLGGGVLVVDHAGPLVEHADYVRLKAEVERLTAMADENAHLHKGIYSLSLNVVQLKDEVERLRKAGDKLVFALEAMDIIMDMDSEHPEVAEWNAVKEGKV